MIDRRLLRSFDYTTLLVLAALFGIGLMLVASASSHEGGNLARRQAVWSLAGLGLAALFGALDYRKMADRAYLLWVGVVALLVVVLLFAPRISGARSWLQIGGFGLQPSEFTKVVLALALARLFADREPGTFGIGGVVVPALLVAVPLGLTALQPDLGTAATFVPILAAIVWVAGLRLRTLGWLAVGTLLVSPLGWLALEDYQRARLTGFLNPEADPLGGGYQLVQSKIAIGSGGLVGKGLFSGTQSQLDFLPEQHNDFIMALMGEELGFLGVGIALILYLVLILRLVRGVNLSRDRVGAYLSAGMAALLAFHLAVNVGMVIGYVPITGIPLPLLSYGGSSALATSIGIGLVISVRSRRYVV